MSIGTSTIRSTSQSDRNTRSISNHSKQSPSKPKRLQANTNNIENAKRSYERYMTLARSAASTGDAVQVENFYQHAEHYLRLMRKQTV